MDTITKEELFKLMLKSLEETDNSYIASVASRIIGRDVTYEEDGLFIVAEEED